MIISIYHDIPFLAILRKPVSTESVTTPMNMFSQKFPYVPGRATTAPEKGFVAFHAFKINMKRSNAKTVRNTYVVCRIPGLD